VIVVIILAVITVGIWTTLDSLGIAIEHATALLIVTCPCALGLATPMAMSVALGRSARAGMLVKSAVVLEQLAKPGSMLLDKTGTLTNGTSTVVDSYGDENLLKAAASIEHASTHPIARAIAGAFGDDLPAASDIKQTTAQGIEGVVNNERITIGSVNYVTRLVDIQVPDELQPKLVRLLDRALSPILVYNHSTQQTALIGVGDQLRNDTKPAINQLQSRGWDLAVCSGDHPRIVESIAHEVGIENHEGAVTPETKALRIQEQKDARTNKRLPVVMVGDGVNDAAALASADVGIAVHGGAEASLEAADVYLVHPGVTPIVNLVDLSRSTMSTIRMCLIFSLTYNAITASLAIAGFITAFLAAILMPISSLTVVAICTRAGKNTTPQPEHP
jgi:Cu2+-exporting ATPase